MPLVKVKTPVETAHAGADRGARLLLERLQSTSSRLEKVALLREHSGDKLFTDLLHFLLNPYITTGLSDKKINKPVLVPGTATFETLEELLEYVSKNNTGTDEVIANVAKFIKARPSDMADFYRSVLTKSMRLGCGAITVNQVMGDTFIPRFEVMLAEKYFDNPQKVEGKEFTVTLKLDGIRCIAIKQDGKVTFLSRQGQEILGLNQISSELMQVKRESFVLDGELLVDAPGLETSADQYKATTQVVRRDGPKTGVTFYVFDVLTTDEFQSQTCVRPYTERRLDMRGLLQYLDYVTPLPALYSGDSTDRIVKLLDLVRKQNKEGVMININDAPYEFKRTSNLLKVKAMQDVDLKITGFEEGIGRLSGTLGRINVDYKGNELGVGSGYSDEERKWFWDNRDSLIGRVITVQYFEETSNASGGVSLRFPVFKELREEGKEVSYN